MKLIGRYWRQPKILWGLMSAEFLFTVATLTLFGIADPDTYRTKLWQEGADHGWNSDPKIILLSHANHDPVDTPLVWSRFLNSYNVVISVLSMFLLLTKSVMFIMNIFWPAISILVHAALIALYAYSTYAQSSSDTIDPAHEQGGAPWFLTRSCSQASSGALEGYCQQAKACFAMTIIMMALFVTYLAYSIWSNFTGTKPLDEEEDEFAPSQAGYAKSANPGAAGGPQWEMQDFRSPGTTGGIKSPGKEPYTPRTMAFRSLGGGGGDLPLRQQ